MHFSDDLVDLKTPVACKLNHKSGSNFVTPYNTNKLKSKQETTTSIINTSSSIKRSGYGKKGMGTINKARVT